MRGKVKNVNTFVEEIRITPACAGKRWMFQSSRKGLRDHPRLCGEKPEPEEDTLTILGSPPLVRGKVSPFCFYLPGYRITPACAGKSLTCFLGTVPSEDHPRLCGEKNIVVLKGEQKLGSPPLVRGKVSSISYTPPSYGITPACAGKSIDNDTSSLLVKDHPRLCGEKKVSNLSIGKEKGSPPLVRGKESGNDKEKQKLRITPACAGKSSSVVTKYSDAKDHPRLCGEKCSITQ